MAKSAPIEQPATATAGAAHPLAPLQPEEINAATAALAACGQLDMASAMFAHTSLLEPTKAAVQAYDGGALPRGVRLVGIDGGLDGGFQADVTLSPELGVEVTRIPNTGQATYGADLGIAMMLVFACPEYATAMAARGFEVDPDHIQIDPWPAGGFPHSSIPAGHRACRALSFIKDDATDNGYAKPVQGLIVHVDLTAKKVAFVEDHGAQPTP